MSLSRRSFLKQSLGASALVATSASVPGFLARTAVAATSGSDRNDKILVVVQLAGGNDSLNSVVPYTDDLYATSRPTLRLPANKLHKIDSDFGFHPQLSAFHRLHKEGLLSVLQGVGYPNPNQDHTIAMRVWQSGNPNSTESHTGWLGRAVDQACRPEDPRVPAVFLGQIARPFALNAESAIIPSIQSLDQYTLRAGRENARKSAARPAGKPPAGDSDSLLPFVERATLTARATSKQVEAAARSGISAAEYPPFQFAGTLRTIAQLIRAEIGVRIIFTELGGNEPGGFDTHASQAANHGALLEQLSESLAAFVGDLKRDKLLDRVLLMTFSEFGRTVAENGRRGTDHGSAQSLFVVGGKLRGGLIGKHPPLDDLEGTGQRSHTDFRRVYATLLDRWLGLDSQPILGGKFAPVDFLRA
jgi:uncharacterized protein (DUF1501 family)